MQRDAPDATGTDDSHRQHGTRPPREGRAVVARRSDPGGDPDTTEIRRLARAGGYEVAASLEQVRAEDAATNLGAGKVEQLAAAVEETDADAAVVDNELTPSQTHELRGRLPAGTEVVDRYRLVLAVFARGAASRRAKLQVEHARLRYELPRLRERVGEDLEGERYMEEYRDEEPKPVEDLERRIDDLDRKLKAAADAAAQHRRQRRKQGFDLVALAGYTNAGKSTLLRRLADDVDRGAPDHPDVEGTVTVEDRPFETLETTTRRATVDDRAVMLTDTVGFVQQLPHELVESFSPTLDEAGAADVVVVVADASHPPDRLRDRLATTVEVLDGTDPGEVVVALNKVDLVDGSLAERRAAIDDLASDPVPVSATEGQGLDRLRERIAAALPTERATIALPNDDAGMGLVSELYDTATVLDVTYGDRIRVELACRPGVVERARGRAASLREAAEGGPRPTG